MKKIILGILIYVEIIHAGLWSTVSGMSMKERKPQAAYTIDTAGLNPRIYEFDSKKYPYIHCIVLFTNGTNGVVPTMQCIKK